jgi:hypothetical protein
MGSKSFGDIGGGSEESSSLIIDGGERLVLLAAREGVHKAEHLLEVPALMRLGQLL